LDEALAGGGSPWAIPEAADAIEAAGVFIERLAPPRQSRNPRRFYEAEA
jgi:hypothetical protein